MAWFVISVVDISGRDQAGLLMPSLSFYIKVQITIDGFRKVFWIFCAALLNIFSQPSSTPGKLGERAFCTCCDPTWLGRCMNAALAWDLILIGKHCHLDSCRKDAGQKEPGQWCLLPALMTYCHLGKYYIYYIYAIKQEFWHISFIHLGRKPRQLFAYDPGMLLAKKVLSGDGFCAGW